MRLEEIIARLERVGLDEERAHVYVRLLQNGPSKVSQLKAFVETSRTKLYRVLDDLSERGIVTKSLERPTIYEAVDPEELFDAAVRSVEDQRADLEETRDELLGPLEQLADDSVEHELYRWQLLEGAARIYGTIQDLLQRAERSIHVATNHELSRADLPVVADMHRVLRRRANQVDARVLASPVETAFSVAAGPPPASPVQARKLAHDRVVHFVIVDGTELVTWSRLSDGWTSGPEDVALWTEAPGLVAVHELLFDRLWREASPIEGQAASAVSGDGG